MNLQQIYEAGDPFERLIDHPSYVGKVRHFLGGEGTFDYAQGELFIDENFASIRGPGEAIGVHSGAGPGNSMRNQSFYKVRAIHLYKSRWSSFLIATWPVFGAE